MKEPKIVALYGFDVVGSVVRFKSAEETFRHVVSCDAPAEKDFENFNSASDFVALSSDDNTKKCFRNFVLLPPHVVVAFLSMSSRGPSMCSESCIWKFQNELQWKQRF